MIRKVLVANRGEIAVRIIRACRERGLASVAVFSDADATALHTQLAEQAIRIGPPPARESYLSIPALIEAARKTGADTVHPGYGFLAENADFAESCAEAGLTFVGPPPEVIRALGDKTAARKTMAAAGVPVVPGTEGENMGDQDLAAFAGEAGYPILIKAAGGGGGKGMRRVERPEDLQSALEACRREAGAAFGDDRVFLERYLEPVRHVEVQVLADGEGNRIHLFERECSLQRRHQKVLEEAPAATLDRDLRRRLGEAALSCVEASRYVNAGTVEFLVDPRGQFYFLEVNTRLQVEHPVTEAITGVDLVHQQLHIAGGGRLDLRQEDLAQRGHAMECRIYAEDPARDFFPSAGPVLALREPSGPGVRVDSGIYGGFTVPIEYDPLLAKLISFAADREACRLRMAQALADYQVLGVTTNLSFLRKLVRHPDFIAGDVSTGFLGENFAIPGEPDRAHRDAALAALAIAEVLGAGAATAPNTGTQARAGRSEAQPGPWQRLKGWRSLEP